MRTQYRIVDTCGQWCSPFMIEKRTWWFPVWQYVDFASSQAEARDKIKRLRNRVVEVFT